MFTRLDPRGADAHPARRYRPSMETANGEGMLGLLVLVVLSLAVVVYVFLRMAGILPRKGRRHEIPPPPPPAG